MNIAIKYEETRDCLKEIKNQIKKYLKERDIRIRIQYKNVLVHRIVEAMEKKEITYENGEQITYARLPLMANLISKTLDECNQGDWIKVI